MIISVKSFNKIIWHFIYLWTQFLVRKKWKKKFRQIFDHHPDLKKSKNKDIIKKHKELWKTISNKVNVETCNICINLSGNKSHCFVPEEIYESIIEQSLNKWNKQIQLLENKSSYSRWYPDSIFPLTFIHNINGTFYDKDFKNINSDQLDRIINDLNYPLVIKPNIGSMGGKNVLFIRNEDELKQSIKNQKNFVIQKKIDQSEYFSTIHKSKGLNTIRVCLYKSISDEKYHYLNSALRMSIGNSLDNLTDGGIVCSIKDDGTLNSYAVDFFCNKYHSHPDSKISFSEMKKIPHFKEMKNLAIYVAEGIFFSRLVSLDMCLDHKGNWRVIEINLTKQSIRLIQYGGKPFFGKYTTEVIDYCKRNPWFNKLNLK